MTDQNERDDEEALESSEAIADQSLEIEDEQDEERPRLNLDVKIDDRSACERHITVAVSRKTSIAIWTKSIVS